MRTTAVNPIRNFFSPPTPPEETPTFETLEERAKDVSSNLKIYAKWAIDILPSLKEGDSYGVQLKVS